jgi:hypothetical protein
MRQSQANVCPYAKPRRHPAGRVNRIVLSLGLAGLTFFPMTASSVSSESRGIQFLAFRSFTTFQKSPGPQPGQTVWTSPELRTKIHWDELVVSWNAETPPGTGLKFEARALHPDRATKWFNLGFWSDDPEQHPRKSLRRQKDDDGDVDTDTLMLTQPAERLQLRVTFTHAGKQKPKLKFLGASLLDTQATPDPLPPHRSAWGKTLPVPERSQMAYEGGDVWCSPTTISMMLAYWSARLKRPELDRDVPEIVQGVFDPMWGGTGNWVFNTAYAGSFRGMRAYTARLSDVAELEEWIARGIPVGLSLCYNRLRGKSREPSGHLVVCVGFTETGNVIVNDPGTSKNVQKKFPRANLVDAWAYKKNTVYLLHPEKAKLPADRFGHWDAPTPRPPLRAVR